MPTISDHPWTKDLLEQLACRSGERILQIGGHDRDLTQSLTRGVGPEGSVWVIEPDRERAEALRALDQDQLTILAHAPGRGEHFGHFDAAVNCADHTLPDCALLASLRTSNLRPGGRFVIDLPDRDVCETMRQAWMAAGGAEEEFEVLCGPEQDEFAEALREQGLRHLEVSAMTYLLRRDSPLPLAEEAVQAADQDLDFIDALNIALVEALGSHTSVEVVWRRLRAQGIR